MTEVNINHCRREMVVRNTKEKDIERVVEIAVAAFGNPDIAFDKEHFASHVNVFPEGQFCVEYKGKVVASCSSLIVNYKDYGDDHSLDEISDNGYITNHDPQGTHLYGIDVVVHPDFRKLKIGKCLYEARRDLCKKLNLQGIIFGGRLPNYHKHAKEMSVQEYIQEVKEGNLYDPVLVFQMRNGFHLRDVKDKYLKNDKDSLEYAAIMEWPNPEYVPKPPLSTQSS